MVMDIVIDIQGFRDVDEQFIPKEVAVVAINDPIIGHWIMMPPYPFGDLPEKARRENNWLSRNYHGIEWFDGEVNSKYFTIQLREITRQARYIYSRGQEKANYLRNLLSRNVYNLEGISPPLKNLPDAEERGHRCAHHGFRANAKFTCALRNAYKLKRWLIVQNSDNSSCESLPSQSWDDSDEENFEDAESGIFPINRNFDITRNIQTWRENNSQEEKNQSTDEQTRGDYSIAKDEERIDLSKSVSTIDKNKTNARVTFASDIPDNSALLSSVRENTESSSSTKEANCEFIQLIPLSRPPPNEYFGNLTSIASSQCQTCRGLSCGQTSKGVDEVDRNCR